MLRDREFTRFQDPVTWSRAWPERLGFVNGTKFRPRADNHDTYVSCRATACGEPGPRFALAIDRARVNSPYCAGGVEVPKAPPADRQLIATRDEIDVDSATEAERVRHSLYALYVLAES